MTSHNLRGPLASTLGIINLLRDYMQTSADLKGLYDHLRGSAMKIDEVLQDVSMLLETRDATPINNEEIEINSLLDGCMAKLREHGLDLTGQVTKEFSACPSVIATRPYLESILMHLLSNAFQYRAADRKPAIRVSSVADGEFVRIDVTDNGEGIASDDLEKIFEPFKKLHYSSTGKGLGLYLARTQTEALGGSLGVSSEPGVGSCFSIRVPIKGLVTDF